MHYHCKDPEKPRVLLLGPDTGVSALNRGRITINSGYGIRLGTELLGLNDKSEVALRNRLWGVRLLIIDELYMESNDLWTNIDSRLGNIYNDSWKSTCWSFNYECSWLASTTSSQRNTYIFSIFW